LAQDILQLKWLLILSAAMVLPLLPVLSE